MPKVLNLDSDEQLIKAVYQHPYVLRWKIILIVILIVSPFFFLTLLLRWPNLGLLVFFIILFTGLFYLIKTIFFYRATKFYITNKKIVDVDQQSLFHKVISESPVKDIIDISYVYKGLAQNLFNFGNLSIVIAQGTSKILLRNISKPQNIQKLLFDLITKNTKTDSI